MFKIEHNDAIALEYEVRRLYGCDRSGVSGLADADDFLCKYDTIFKFPEEYDVANEVENYIKELADIVDNYT